MVLEGSGETDLTFGLTTPPAQPPDEMGALVTYQADISLIYQPVPDTDLSGCYQADTP